MNPGRYTASWVRYYAGWCDKLDGEVMSAEAGLAMCGSSPTGWWLPSRRGTAR